MPRARATTHETSAAHVGPEGAVAHAGETAHDVRARIRRSGKTRWELLCVVDADGRLVGTMTAAELMALPDDADVAGPALTRGGPHVLPGADQERMASLALHHEVVAMPVVGEDGRLVGVVGPARLMRILRREHVEDLHRLAGITRETEQAVEAREALEEPPMRRVRHRLPWLLAGLAGSIVATLIVSRFEKELTAMPALAFFVPGLVYLAAAVGTQTQAVAVRGLSLSHAPLARLVGGELRTGALIGGLLALFVLSLVWAVFGETSLALAVALALAAASIVASVLGLLLPWLLSRLGSDPAYGSGPLATILQDVLSLLIYFAFVTAIVT